MMPVSTLDPKTAFIVIDLQNGITALPTVHPIAEIVGNAALLAAAFRRRSLPVVLVNVDSSAQGRSQAPSRALAERPPGWADFVPELDQQSGDHVVTKRTWGAFTHTDLESHLRSLGVTNVVIAGVTTHAGVESTARFAHELGFNVTLAADAMTDVIAEAHHNSITHVFPRIAEIGTTQEILAMLDRTHRST